MTDMITRCPSCETSFRITEAQLKTAKGSVRCGSCLQIFKAANNLVLRKKPAPKVEAPTKVVSQPVEAKATPVDFTPEPSHPPEPESIELEIAETEVIKQETAEPKEIEFDAHSEDFSEAEISPIFEFDDRETEDIEPNLSSAVPEEEPQTPFEIFAEAVKQSEPHNDDFDDQALPEAQVEELEESFIEEPFIEEPLKEKTLINEDSLVSEALVEESLTEELFIDQPANDAVNHTDIVIENTPQEKEVEFDMPKEEAKSTFSFDQAAIDNDDSSDSHSSIDDDDLLISDEMEFEDDEPKKEKGAYGEDLVESFLDLDTWQPTSSSLFDHGNGTKKDEDDEDGEKDPDESWAIDLLEDEEDDDAYPASAKSIDLENPDTEDDAIDSLGMIGVVDDLKRSTDDYSRANTGSFAAVEDEDFDKYDHEDHLGESLSEKVAPNLDDDESADFEAPYSEPHDDGFDDYEDEDEYDDYSDDPKNRGALLRRIQPEPVEFAFYQGGNSWGKRLLWSGIVALGIVVLILQIAWLQFDSLSRQEPYRAWYTTFCPMFGCTVPDLAAPQLIRTSNLVVRSHPTAANALMIDTILRNSAPYQQPFPDLVLTFSNLQGKTLASRRFTPAEYLGGEMAGKSNEMPSNQPIHLSLEIADPGPDAVNYSVFIPN